MRIPRVLAPDPRYAELRTWSKRKSRLQKLAPEGPEAAGLCAERGTRREGAVSRPLKVTPGSLEDSSLP